MKRSRYPLSHLLIGVGIVLAAGALAVATASLSAVKAAGDPDAMQAVQTAWQRAGQSGAYHFRTEIVQTTHPAPRLSNVGRSSRVETVYLDGQTDVRQRQFLMTLWNRGGNALSGQDGVEIRVEGDKTYGRTTGADWQEMPDFASAFAPGNDLMAYLAGVRDVRETSTSVHLPDTPYAVSATEYAFTLDGPSLARHVRDQLEKELVRKGELPAGLTLDVSNVYHNATGQGQVWVGADGLPLRLSLHMLYPRQENGEQVEADLKTDFSNFAAAQASNPLAGIAASLNLPRTPRDWQQAGAWSIVALSLGGLLIALITRARSRMLYRALVLVMILSMLSTPLFDSNQVAAFAEKQNAKQAALEKEQADQAQVEQAQARLAGSPWNPNQDPLQGIELAAGRADPVPPPVPSLPNILLAQGDGTNDPYAECSDAEKATDSDQDLLTDCKEKLLGTDKTKQDSDDDGLWDGWEVLRLGTDPTKPDSDGDGISDYLEVNGFTYQNKRWYSDPNSADTDKDGLADNIECPERVTVKGVTPSVDTACRDTDGDGTPDLFDLDSDNDGVPDQQDISPLTVVGKATPFSRTNPFQWQASNFALKTGTTQTYYPVLVDYYLRPANPAHLTYVMNVLDWPSGDEQGQVQRRTGNDTTFADLMSESEREQDPRAQNGDVRLIPMLEIEMSGNNLPLPFTTTLQTNVQVKGVDTSWPISTQPPVFTTWLTASINFAAGKFQGTSSVTVTVQFQGQSSLDRVAVHEGTCSDPGWKMGESSAIQSSGSTFRLNSVGLPDVADGNHFVVLSKSGHTPACAQIPDLVTGPYTDRMVDQASLATYGMTARDKAESGAVVAYVPINVVPDASGGGRVAFSAHAIYFPNNGTLGSATQKVRLVWMVQALSDMCKPIPADVGEQDVPHWCDYTQSWDLNVSQVIHVYSDDWYLTGLSVREDHGFNLAIVWEDPAAKTSEQRQMDTWLWPLSAGLEEAFVSGRDQDDNDRRDVGVTTTAEGQTVADTTISSRFNAPLAASVTITDRWGIPLTATLHVENVAYATQDQVAFVMMSDTARILNNSFAAYTSTTPSLLFAREERYRTANLDVQNTRTIVNNVVTFDLVGQPVDTLAGINWAPYRYSNGAWRSFPLADYWDLLGARLKASLPLDTDVPADTAETIRDGQIALARMYYLTMNQGRVGLVSTGVTLLYPYNPLQGDGSLSMTISLLLTRSGYGATSGAATVVSMVTATTAPIYEKMANLQRLIRMEYEIRVGTIEVMGPKQTFLYAVGKGIKETVSSKLDPLLDAMNSLADKLNSEKGAVGLACGIAVGVAAGIAVLLGVGFGMTKSKELMLSFCVSAVLATVQVGLMIKTVADAIKHSLDPITKFARVSAVIGLIVGIAIAFAGLIATLVAGHLKLSSIAAHAAIAEAIAYAVVATIMMVISLIPVVGQIIAAVIGAIDSLILAICGLASAIVGYDVRTNAVGQWLCKGIQGLTSELVKWTIFSAKSLTDLQDPNRLQFGRFNYDLVEPDQGLAVGNNLYLTLDLTSTIKLESVLPAGEDVIEGWKNGTNLIPVDWKSISYWWQFSDANVKRSTFKYQIQSEEADIHDPLDLGQMKNEWQPAQGESARPLAHTFSVAPTPKSDAILLDTAGINQIVKSTLTEGVDVASQECWTVPNPVTVWMPGLCLPVPYPYVCLIPVCVIRGDKNSNHIDLGNRFTLDVLPATLDGFYQATARDGGFTLAWGQGVGYNEGSVTFKRQLDLDGDGLLNQADGGSDPDDSKWDTDGDGLSDAWELAHNSDPALYDTDGDGLSDAEEFRLGTDPTRKDTDGDGLTDKEEVTGWEMVYAIAPDGASPSGDSQLRTWVTSNPLAADEDADGLSDFKEKTFGFNPHVPSDPTVLEMSVGTQEPSAPLLLLRLDEAAGAQTFADRGRLAGNAAACTSGACPDAGQDGRYGYAAQFSSGDYLSLPNSPVNRARNNLTVAAWVYPTQVTGQQNILSTARTTSDNGFVFGLQGQSPYFQTRGVAEYRGHTLLQASQWTHVAAVMDSSNSVSFYVNGKFQEKINYSGSAIPDMDDMLLVSSPSALESMNGRLDDVAFFDRALTSDEIQAVMQGRFNVSDQYVTNGETMAYTTTLTNKLMGRYAQGLLSVNLERPNMIAPVMPPSTFVLQPVQTVSMTSGSNLGPFTSGPISLTQAADALITDWREQSNYAQLWLPLDEAADQTVFQDHSGTLPAANGVCSGSTCPTRQEQGYFDYALGFSGSQFVTLTDTARLGLKDSSFSVSAWVKTSSSTGDRKIMSTAGGAALASAPNPALTLMLHNGVPAMGFANNILSASKSIADDRWYHLVFRYDKDKGEQSIYINTDLGAIRTGITAFTGTGVVSLGNTWVGWLDDVRVYNRALTVSEIRELYNRPVLRLQFEESTAPSPSQPQVQFADISGQNNGGSCSGGACPTRASGVIGPWARRFDGNDIVSVPGRPGLSLSDGQFTLAAWVKPDPQPEPVNPACPFTAGYLLASTPQPTGCAGWDGWTDPDNGLMLDVTPPGGYTRYYSGTFNFPAGYYNFTIRTGIQGKATVYVDGVQIASAHPWHDNASYVEFWDTTSSNLRYYLSAGVHQIKIHADSVYGNRVQFAFSPPYAQGILGSNSGGKAAYPTLQTVGRQVRVGFGTGSEWVSRTTTNTVLTANAWNHVVATYDANELMLYVNNTRVAVWNLGGVKPVDSNTLKVGTSAQLGKTWIDHLHVYDARPGTTGETLKADFSIKWNGSVCHPTSSTNCQWNNLWDGDTVDVDDSESVGASSTMELVHRYLSTDHILCLKSSAGSETCQSQYEFNSNNPGLRFLALNNSNTYARLYLGDDTHWAYYNNAVPFRGSLDDVSIYRRPLSPEEINELYTPAGTVLHLKLDEAPGVSSFENAVDLSRQSNAFCATAGSDCPTTGVAGRINQAALFNGATNWISTTLMIDPTGGATLMAWVRPASTGNVTQTVLSTDGGAGGWAIARDGLRWKVMNGQTLVDTGAAVTTGVWQHVAATYRQGQIYFFLNGQLVNSTPLTTTSVYSGTSLAVGRRPAGGARSSASYWAGEVDDVRVFNTVLSPSAIQALYQKAPIVQLHLDESPGSTQFSNTGSALSGACASPNCPTVGMGGQVSRAAEFNLTPGHFHDRIEMTADTSLNLSQFTVGAWVQPSAIMTHEQWLVNKDNNYRLLVSAGGLTPTLTFAPVSGGGCGAVQSLSSRTRLLPNQWNHVMGTYDGSTARLYVNGYEQASLAVGGNACASTANVSLGGTAASGAFAGRLDEVTLYNYALNAFEVRDTFRYQGKLVQERRGDTLYVDNDPPISALRSYTSSLPYLANRNVLMHVEAHDALAGVAQVELLADTPSRPGVWFPAPSCADDEGGTAWCPLFKPSGEGEYRFTTRATDWAGNQGTSSITRLYVDGTPPSLSLAQSSAQVISAQRHSTLENTWLVHLNGTVSDPNLDGHIAGSGIQTDSVRVALMDSTGAIVGGQALPVVLSGTAWSLDYAIKSAQPTGRYTVRITAVDRVGNSAQLDRGPFQVDAAAPGGDVNAANLSTVGITTTQTLQGVASEAPAPRDTALLLHLEENTGVTRFYDNSGAFHHAECISPNCPTAAATGQYGRAAQFNGSSNYLQVAHSSINERTAGLSVAAWIKPGTSSGTQRLVSTAQTHSANGFSFGVVHNGGLRNGTLLFSAMGVKDYATGAVDLSNRWMHVAAVVDESNTVRLYQDGNLQAVYTSTVPLLADTDDVLLIGAGMNVSSTTPVELYNGLLDEVIVVERALSADDVRTLAQPQTAGLAGLQMAFRSTLPGSAFYNETPLTGETLHLTLDDTPDQNSALTWRDVSGQGHHGACSGASCPAYGTSGHTGSAALFDGQQNSIALSNWGTFTTTTVSAWVKRSGATSARETIVSYKEASSCGLVLSLNEDKANHYPRIYVRVSGVWRYAEQAVSLPLDTWVHLAATYDGATIRLYRDGQLVASTAAAGSMSQCSAVSAVGSRSDGVSHRFPGVIDEVRMFDRALAADTLREQLYLGSEPTLALPLDEQWALDGSRLPDASGWAHDGTLHTGSDNTNKAMSGAVGSFGLQLDGVDDYVAVPSALVDQQAGLLPGSRFSLAAWVYPTPVDSNVYPIISSDAYTSPLYASPYLQVVNRTGLQTSFSNGTQAPPLSVSNVLTENTWNHVAATFDGTTYRLYVNGVERLASAAFAGQRPVGINRLDVGRGLPGTSACVAFSRLTLTPRSMGFYNVALNGTTLYQSASQTTPNTTINISTAALVCAPSTLQVTYTGPMPATNWQRSITLNPQPGQGSQTLSHPTYNYTADVAWTLAAQPSSLRYWRGGLDDVRVYARALLPLEVQTLYLSGWQTATLAQSGSGVNLSSWSAPVPSGLEGSFALDLRGVDAAGHVGVADRAAQAWNGQVDTLAPRVSTTRTVVGNKYHFRTVAQDFNLALSGFSSACGAGVISTTETYQSPWYQATVGQSSLGDKVYRLTAECDTAQSGLFETGVWADQTVNGNIAISGTQAYVPASALWRVDLSKPNLPNSPTSYNSSGDGRSVALSGSRAYIADGSQILTIVDLSDPGAAPVHLNAQAGLGIANTVVVSGSYAYLAIGNGFGTGLAVVDISNPNAPALVGSHLTSDNGVALALYRSGSNLYGYLALGAFGMQVLDLNSPTTPSPVGGLAPGNVQDVAIQGARAYLAVGSAGLVIADITNPTTPQIVGQFDTPGNALGVVVSGTNAYVADGYAGIHKLDISNPLSPTLLVTSDTPGYASKVALMGHYLLVSDGSGGLRVLDTLAPSGQATACDTSGNCTTAMPGSASHAAAPAAPADTTSPLGVSILDVPPVITSLEARTVTGRAWADVSSLHTLTFTVDGAVLYTTDWVSGAMTQTVWQYLGWDPSTLADGPHTLQVQVSDWADNTAGQTLPFMIDTLAPGIGIAQLVTGTHYHAPGMLELSGPVSDSGGIKSVEVTVAGETLRATVEDADWHADWPRVSSALPDGMTQTVSARALDVGGHVTVVTETVVMDVSPPAPVTLTVQSGGGVITPGLTLRGLTPTLELSWTASSDGSGLATYRVEWTAAATSTQYIESQAHYPDRTSTFTPTEGSQVWARVGSEDIYGQQSWQSIGPFYVDRPTTPDHVVMDAQPYRGWMDSGCSLVGVDRRLSRQAAPGAALSAEQKLHASWDTEALRLAWTGANWDKDGDLFVYLDVRAGGAITLFNPYSNTLASTIFLPGVTPTSTVNAMAADYVVWVRDSGTALLLQWQGDYWDWVTTLDSSQYRFSAGPDAITDLRLPFDLLGITDPANTALDMVVLASEENALRLWAAMPATNPVNSSRVAQTTEGASGEFALSQRYHWAQLASGICLNGSDSPSPARYADTEVRVHLSVEPGGIVYSFVEDDLRIMPDLWAALLAGQTPDISSQLSGLSTDYARVGANQMLTYTLTYRNRGTDTASNVWVDLQALYTLRLAGADAVHQTLALGDIAPGQEGQVTFTARIDLAASTLPWARLYAQVYDDQHGTSGEPLDRIWADHQVDRAGPQFLGIQSPDYVLAAGNNILRGYVYDESPVPAVTLDVPGRGPITCADDAPSDGAWACGLDATGASDGDILNVTLRAADVFGQASPAVVQTFVVDTLPPTVTLDMALSQAAPGSLIQGNSVRLNGQVADNHGLGRAEACEAGVCAPLSLQFAASGASAVLLDDAPTSPISITSAAACAGGTPIVRTFDVSESFLLGSVNVGLAATHSHRNDLQVDLESPTGVRVRLLTDDGVSGNNARNYDVLLSDAAGSAYSDAGDDNPATPWGGFVRSARPAQPLRAFVGLSSQGQWKLTVCDANPAQNAVAYLNSRLVLYPQAALTIPSAGNWAYTLFADGKLDSVVRTVSFYGVDLAGNRTTEPLVTSYTLDNVAPVITVTDVVNTALYSASLTVLTGTVTDGGGVSAMLVSVEGDQAVYQDIAEQEGNTWRYVMHPMTPGRYTLHVSAFDAVGNVTTIGPFEVNVQTPVHSVIYLPLISRNYVYAPDLVVKQLLVSSSAIQVIVENQGAAPVVDEFWVDVYINPTTPPVRVNQTWNQLGTQGLVWGVTSPALPALTPGGVLTLTVGDAYYQPTLSRVSWPLPTGTPVYAQADSADASTTYGAVLEIHEINGDPYNNISGPVLPAALDLLSLPASDALQAASSPHLPRRP